jgi:hypothetical protein
MRNRIMHALNGNRRGNLATAPKIQAAVRQEIAKDLKPIKKEVKKANKPRYQVQVKAPRAPVRQATLPGNAAGSMTGNGSGKRIMLSGQSPKTDFERVQLAMALPAAVAPVRYNDGFSVQPTAVANPWEVSPVSFGATSPALPATGDNVMCVFRSSIRSTVRYMSPESITGAPQYDFKGKSNGSPLANQLPSLSWQVKTFAGPTIPLHVPYAVYNTAIGGTQVHGDTMYGHTVDGDCTDPRRFFWLDRGTVTLNFTNTVTDVATTFGADYCDEGGIEENVYFTTASGSAGVATNAAFNVAVAGYYSLWVSCGVAQTTAPYLAINSIKFVIDKSMGCFSHRPLPGFALNFASLKAVRIFAASVQFTNEAAELYRAGKIAGYQVPQSVHWETLIAGGQTGISSSNGAVTMPIDKGIYGFLKQTQPSDFNFLDEYEVFNGSLLDSYAAIMPKSSYLCVYANVASTTGQDAFWTICHGIEYLTSDVWRVIDRTAIPPTVFRTALEKMQLIDQWYENPVHAIAILGRILGIARSITGAVVKFGPRTLKGIEGVHKFIGGNERLS